MHLLLVLKEYVGHTSVYALNADKGYLRSSHASPYIALHLIRTKFSVDASFASIMSL